MQIVLFKLDQNSFQVFNFIFVQFSLLSFNLFQLRPYNKSMNILILFFFKPSCNKFEYNPLSTTFTIFLQ